MKLILKEVNARPFKGDDGEVREYFWYKALRQEDNVTLQFGSVDGDHLLGVELELNVEKSERINNAGKTVFVYREVKTV